MLWRLLDISFGNLRGRPGHWLALVGQLAALFGVPLPVVAAKDVSSPFPCQHRQCGCLRAANCWNHCCCFSAHERVAWARENHADVPESLVEQAQTEGDCGTCCHKPTAAAKKASGFVLGFMARQCQGQDSPWGCGEPAPAPVDFVTWQFDWRPAGWCQAPSWDAPFVDLTPPERPPRG